MAHWSVAATAGIAHRGASAELPEHTREAYELAVAEGADFIECDVVLTADLVPLCRHEPNLINSTDAVAKFPERWREYVIDGEMVAGIFSVDLTAAEVATLRAIQPWPFRNQSYNGRFRIATLADYLEVALSANRSVGIYPETKHPTWTNSLLKLRAANTSLEDILLDALTAAGFGAPLDSEAWMRRPIFLQSFEASSLRYLATRTCAPTVLLLGDWEGTVSQQPTSSATPMPTGQLGRPRHWSDAGPADGGLLIGRNSAMVCSRGTFKANTRELANGGDAWRWHGGCGTSRPESEAADEGRRRRALRELWPCGAISCSRVTGPYIHGTP
ncbi:hypothetical protein Vafri_771 [Volvox africanus]|nr:hypothetical protein Vafri_771 [Volvox africanus]